MLPFILIYKFSWLTKNHFMLFNNFLICTKPTIIWAKLWLSVLYTVFFMQTIVSFWILTDSVHVYFEFVNRNYQDSVYLSRKRSWRNVNKYLNKNKKNRFRSCYGNRFVLNVISWVHEYICFFKLQFFSILTFFHDEGWTWIYKVRNLYVAIFCDLWKCPECKFNT